MSARSDSGSVASRLLTTPPLAMDTDTIVRDFTHYFRHTLGRRVLAHDSPFVYRALVLVLRDRLIERLNDTAAEIEGSNRRQACYLSLEYLMGRLLRNAVLNLGLEDVCEEAFQRLGFSFADVVEAEHDAGLGNGGLGRLAACFLDSCATLKLPVIGYGIRYRYGMFRQLIENGRQVEGQLARGRRLPLGDRPLRADAARALRRPCGTIHGCEWCAALPLGRYPRRARRALRRTDPGLSQ